MDSIHILDSNLQKANTWIKELSQELNMNATNTYNALRGVLIELRDRLNLEEAADFSAELPLFFKGVFYERFKPAKQPIKYTKDEFVSRVHSYLGNDPDIDPNEVVKKVFIFLSKKVSGGEIKDVVSTLPKKIKQLWE